MFPVVPGVGPSSGPMRVQMTQNIIDLKLCSSYAADVPTTSWTWQADWSERQASGCLQVMYRVVVLSWVDNFLGCVTFASGVLWASFGCQQGLFGFGGKPRELRPWLIRGRFVDDLCWIGPHLLNCDHRCNLRCK